MALPPKHTHTHALLDGREVKRHYQFMERQPTFNKTNGKVKTITEYFSSYQFHTEF